MNKMDDQDDEYDDWNLENRDLNVMRQELRSKNPLEQMLLPKIAL